MTARHRHLGFEAILYEEGFRRVVGVDEVGRGPLAGPVVAAACFIPPGVKLKGIRDSKMLTPEVRQELYWKIIQNSLVGIGIASVQEIDELNILKASLLAMKRAVWALPITPDFVLIDGIFKIEVPVSQMPLIQGDDKLITIGAASIVAKVTRDQIMSDYDLQYPVYGFRQHKGYATENHLIALNEWGPSPIHRMSFNPVSEAQAISQEYEP